jgi:hypothetical protein
MKKIICFALSMLVSAAVFGEGSLFINFLGLSAFIKYPFRLGTTYLFPVLGAEYVLALSGNIMDIEINAVQKRDFSDLYALGGVQSRAGLVWLQSHGKAVVGHFRQAMQRVQDQDERCHRGQALGKVRIVGP